MWKKKSIRYLVDRSEVKNICWGQLYSDVWTAVGCTRTNWDNSCNRLLWLLKKFSPCSLLKYAEQISPSMSHRSFDPSLCCFPLRSSEGCERRYKPDLQSRLVVWCCSKSEQTPQRSSSPLCLDPKSRRSTRVKTGSPAKSFIPPVRRIHEINNWYKYCVCSPLSEVQTPTSPFAWIFYGIIIALIPSCQLTKKNVKKKEKVDVIFLHSTAIFDLSCLLW